MSGADGGAARPATVIVVPCFNEAQRLDERAFSALAATGKVRLLFVDDGSTDATAAVLGRLAESCPGVEVFTLSTNTGKAEAVRRGLLVAIRGGATAVGYYDADLATPPGELLRLTATLEGRPELAGVLGSRVARLGSAIERRALRHYLGRTYATVASWALGMTVYDTQCGAKVFRVGDELAAALSQPFRSSWAFDAELLHRLAGGSASVPGLPASAFVEVPLDAWRDVSGSKLGVGPSVGALVYLVWLGLRVRRGKSSHSVVDLSPTSVMAPRESRRRTGAAHPGATSPATGRRRA